MISAPEEYFNDCADQCRRCELLWCKRCFYRSRQGQHCSRRRELPFLTSGLRQQQRKLPQRFFSLISAPGRLGAFSLFWIKDSASPSHPIPAGPPTRASAGLCESSALQCSYARPSQNLLLSARLPTSAIIPPLPGHARFRDRGSPATAKSGILRYLL